LSLLNALPFVYREAAMDRRAFLSTVGGLSGALAGCLGDRDVAAPVPTTSPPSTSSPASIPSEYRRTVSVAEIEATGIDLGVDVLASAVTAVRTATVRLTWTNPGAEPAEVHVSRGSLSELLLSDPTAETGSELVLVPTDEAGEAQSGSCWRLSSVGRDGDVDRTRLSLGESLQNDYEVWTRPDSEGCVPVGTYRFEASNEDDPLSWGATLEVTNPEG
jgi:hypothetical protein